MRFKDAVAVAFSAAAGVTFAAEPPVTVGEPVIVTATRFEDRYLDKPVNVSIITAEDIKNSTARTVPDLLSEQAGIVIHDFFGNNAATTTVDLRGFGITGTQNTLILLDGRRLADNDLSGVQWSAIPPAAIERIEIVRGSGAVQYGDGATTGVINIITKSPARIGNLAVAQGRAGTYDTLEGQLYANYFTGNVGLNLIGSGYRSDGYRDNNYNRQTNVQAEVRFLTERGDTSLKVGTDDQYIRLPGARTVQPSAGINQLETDRRGATTPNDYADRTGNRATLDWRHETGVGQLNLGLGYRDKTQKSYFDRGGDPLFNDYRIADLDVWSVSPRMRFPQALAGLPNTLVVGVDWYHWDYKLRVSNSEANIAQPFNTVNATQENAALYLYNTTQLTPRATLVAGARGERYKIRASDFFDPTAPGPLFGSGAAPGSQEENEYAYELALRYQLSGEWAAVGRLGRSYRFANVDEIYEFTPLFSREFQFLKPQTALSYEAGLERRTKTGALRATLFSIDVEDEIHLDVFSSGIGNTNLPPSRRRGVEIEARQALGSTLRLTGSYTYTTAEFLEGVLPGGPFTMQNVALAGKTVPLVPRHKVNAGASWDFAPKTRLDALASYVGSQYMDNDQGNTGAKIPAYTVADLKLTWEDRGWRLAAAVNNLFDEKYYNYAVRSQFIADRYNAYPLPERNYTVTVEYTFR